MRADIPTDTPTPFLILKHTVLLPTRPFTTSILPFPKDHLTGDKTPVKGYFTAFAAAPLPYAR